jgi:class 3 adenylate cyclase
MVLGTYRDVELRRQHPLAQALGELNRENLSHRVLLRGLTENDVRRFVEVTAGTIPPDALVAAVYKETEGNPFFVNEIVRLLVADGRLENAESVSSWSVTIPQSVKEVVGRRLDRLSDECNRTLTIGAVIGREFGLRLLEKVSEVKGDRLLEVLEEAMGARVIAELPRSIDQYWFSHALIRETLYEELGTTRRIRLHRQIGEALEELDAEGNLPQLAYHFAEAAPAGDIDKAVGFARNAGVRAIAQYAWEDAITQFERALQVLELQTPPDETLKCDMLMALGDAIFGAGDAQRAQEVYRQAVELARRLGDSERLALAALAYSQPWSVGTMDQTVVGFVREALAVTPEQDSVLRARLLSRLGRELYFGQLAESDRLREEAVEVARRVGDKRTLVEVLYNKWFGVTNELEGAEERRAEVIEVMQLANELNDLTMIGFCRFALITNEMILGNSAAAYEEIDKYSRTAEESRMPLWLWQSALTRAMRVMFEGPIPEAEAAALSAFALGQKANPDVAAQMFGAQIYALRREQGRLPEMESSVKGFVQMYPAIPAWRTALAFHYAELGMLDQARAEFDILASDNFSAFPRDGNWPIAMGLLAETAAYLGDRERSQYLYDQLLPVADRCIIVGACVDCYGPSHRLLALLAATMERWDDSERHFEDAIALNEGMKAGRFAGWTFHQCADMLLRRDGPGDREKSLSLLSQALDVAERLGLTALLERSLKLKLKAQGIELSDLGTSIDTVAREALAEQPDLKAHAAPDGTVTIMFSDIEGSTAMADRLGDSKFMAVLREHNAVVRDHVKIHGGFEVKSEGDGFMVAFQSAGRALACASSIQKALAERNGSADEPVRVRMGLHAGEVIKEGEDFFGRNVIIAARVASHACGGEILASSVLKALVEGSDISWGEKRMVQLKGLSGVHEIWPVEWGGMIEPRGSYSRTGG